VGVAALIVVGVLALAGGGSAGAAVDRTQVADCGGPVTIGSGPRDWPEGAELAGPLGVFERPLRAMSETRNGQLITKMPVVVDRGPAATLGVPRRLRHRVFLYYGRMVDRNGEPTTRIGASPGFSEVRFEPCADRRRTAWPGGIRVIGRAPVRLLVRVEGAPGPIPLPLGTPKPYRR
jgi:hypothetical protein